MKNFNPSCHRIQEPLFINSDASELEILTLTPMPRGALKAYVNIRLGEFIINQCRIIQEPGKKAWLSLPVQSYRNELGEIRYTSIFHIRNERLRNSISQVVISAWEKFREGQNNGNDKG